MCTSLPGALPRNEWQDRHCSSKSCQQARPRLPASSLGGYASDVHDSRVSRLRESPWLRGALLVLAVGLAVYGLASQWTEVHAALAKLAGYDVAGALVCSIAGLCCMMLAWRSLLADLGST